MIFTPRPPSLPSLSLSICPCLTCLSSPGALSCAADRDWPRRMSPTQPCREARGSWGWREPTGSHQSRDRALPGRAGPSLDSHEESRAFSITTIITIISTDVIARHRVTGVPPPLPRRARLATARPVLTSRMQISPIGLYEHRETSAGRREILLFAGEMGHDPPGVPEVGPPAGSQPSSQASSQPGWAPNVCDCKSLPASYD